MAKLVAEVRVLVGRLQPGELLQLGDHGPRAFCARRILDPTTFIEWVRLPGDDAMATISATLKAGKT